MITFKRSVLAAALGCSLIGTSAQAGFASFWFDPDGATGGATAFRVDGFMNISALLRIQNTFTNNPAFNPLNPVGPLNSPVLSNFSFNQYGQGTFTKIDGASFSANGLTTAQKNSLGDDVALTLSGVGTGNLGGSLTFGAGQLNIFSPMYSNSIAKFNIVGGSGNIDTTGTPNGQSTLEAKAVSFDAGYFFKDNSNAIGIDLSTVDLNLVEYFAFTTTNLSLIDPPSILQRTIVENAFLSGNDGGTQGYIANGNLNTTLAGTGTPYTQLYVDAGGQFRLQQVPEPGSLALLGLGLVGLAAASRRKAVK